MKIEFSPFTEDEKNIYATITAIFLSIFIIMIVINLLK